MRPRAMRARDRGRRRADLAIGSTAWGADSTGTLTAVVELLRLRVQDRGDPRARTGGELLRLAGVAEDGTEHVLEDVRALDVRVYAAIQSLASDLFLLVTGTPRLEPPRNVGMYLPLVWLGIG